MLTQSHYYNQVIKKCVAVFGTLFNNITIGRISPNGTVISNVERVPIAYGPKQRWLDRIAQQPDLADDKVAIKVPRLSFEMTSIQYDFSIKLNRLNRVATAAENDVLSRNTQWQAVPYKIGMQLNIYGVNQDDVLQIMEQILPEFQPEYTVTVKDLEGPGSLTNVPITLNNVTLSDSFEGDFANTRRAVVYTLDFEMRIRFAGPTSKQKIIKFIEASFVPMDRDTAIHSSASTAEYVHVSVEPNDTPDSYTIHTSIDTVGFSVSDYPH